MILEFMFILFSYHFAAFSSFCLKTTEIGNCLLSPDIFFDRVVLAPVFSKPAAWFSKPSEFDFAYLVIALLFTKFDLFVIIYLYFNQILGQRYLLFINTRVLLYISQLHCSWGVGGYIVGSRLWSISGNDVCSFCAY